MNAASLRRRAKRPRYGEPTPASGTARARRSEADVNVTIERAGNMRIDVPITLLRGFRVNPNIDPRQPKRNPSRITALMQCTDQQTFEHSRRHGGTPPHTTRVLIKRPASNTQFARCEPNLRRRVRGVELLVRGPRDGELASASHEAGGA